MIPARGNRKAFVYSGNYRRAKKDVEDYLEKHYSDLKNCLADHPEFYYTVVRYTAWDSWLTKGSKYMQLKKKDVSNFTKNAEDVIFTFVGVDDKSIIDSKVRKAQSQPDQAVALQVTIELYEMEANTLQRSCSNIW